MGYLTHLLAALVVATVVEITGGRPWGWVGGLAALGLVLPLPHGLGRLTRSLALAGRWRAGRFTAGLLELIGPAAFAAVLWAGWSDATASLGEGSVLGWPGPALLATLAPYVLLEALAIDARVRLVEVAPERLAGRRRFQLRQFGAALLPLAAYLVLSGAVGAVEPLRVRLEEVSLYASLYAVAVLAAFALALPALLARVWDTAPLGPGPLRDFLLDLARRGDFRFRELLVWRTGGAMSNAAIVGFTPGQRIVLMTDALLRELGPRELAAVFGHEMGHSVRRHALLFTVWTLALFLAFEVLLGFEAVPEADSQYLALAALGGVWFVGFGYLSRRAELDADLFALGVTRDPADLIGALERVGGGGSRWRDGWRHFSVANRVLFLRAVAADPQVGRRLRRELRRWMTIGVLAFTGLLGLWLWQQLGRVDAERAWADLRLGQYAAALDRVGADGDPETRRLAELGRRLPADARAPRALLERAREAADTDRLVEARDLAALAALRGQEGAAAAAAWLDARLTDDPGEAARRAGALPPGWAPLVERAAGRLP